MLEGSQAWTSRAGIVTHDCKRNRTTTLFERSKCWTEGHRHTCMLRHRDRKFLGFLSWSPATTRAC